MYYGGFCVKYCLMEDSVLTHLQLAISSDTHLIPSNTKWNKAFDCDLLEGKLGENTSRDTVLQFNRFYLCKYNKALTEDLKG